MTRITGKVVRELRRSIARKDGVPTSEVQVFRGRETASVRDFGLARTRWRHARFTWRITVRGREVHHDFWWASIKMFCDDLAERTR